MSHSNFQGAAEATLAELKELKALARRAIGTRTDWLADVSLQLIEEHVRYQTGNRKSPPGPLDARKIVTKLRHQIPGKTYGGKQDDTDENSPSSLAVVVDGSRVVRWYDDMEVEYPNKSVRNILKAAGLYYRMGCLREIDAPFYIRKIDGLVAQAFGLLVPEQQGIVVDAYFRCLPVERRSNERRRLDRAIQKVLELITHDPRVRYTIDSRPIIHKGPKLNAWGFAAHEYVFQAVNGSWWCWHYCQHYGCIEYVGRHNVIHH